MKKQQLKLLLAVFAFVLTVFTIQTSAQSDWLDMKPLPSWNSRSRAILETKKMPAASLAQCSRFVRPASLAVDRLLTGKNWTLVGPAQVYGRTTVVTVAQGFDGQCRPLEFQTLVFVGNRVAGTLSPGLMNSRTDGYLTNVKMISETQLTTEYARYKPTDALCCPSKIEAVTWVIKPDGANFLLVPEAKVENVGVVENQNPSSAAALTGTKWRWESTQTPVEKTTVPKPENYTLEFLADGKVNVLADCNRGRGSYGATANNLTFSGIALTRKACPPGSLDNRFLRGLEAARIYRIEGDTLLIDMFADGGTMRFVRASAANTGNLNNTVWRWESLENFQGLVKVEKPENYQIQFGADGGVGVKADCNTGGGSYESKSDGGVSLRRIVATQIFCGESSLGNRFLRSLGSARSYRVEGNNLILDLAGDNGTMRFFRVAKQN